MGLRLALVLVAAASAVFAACSLGVDFGGLTGADAPDAMTNGDGATDAPTSDAAPSGDAADSGASDASNFCGDAWAGPSMIKSTGFCIDSTEVTQKDYAAFVIAKTGDFAGQPTECAWNVSWSPGSACPHDSQSTLPANGVDWCDAYAYCMWAGKRLCGKVGGGQEDTASSGGNVSNQWYAACSNAGANAFPYGSVYDPQKCLGGDRDSGRQPVGTSGCEGALPGLFDMSGNVEEWTDLCNPSPDGGPTNDQCARRGGDTGEDPLSLRCVGNNFGFRNVRQCYVGFRCCADL